MIRVMRKIAAVLLLAALATPSLSNAEESTEPKQDPQWVASLLAGPALKTSTGGGTSFIFGVRGGITLGRSPYAVGHLGIAALTTASGATAAGLTSSSRITLLAAEYVAREAWGTGLYLGARVGVALNALTISSATASVSGSSAAFAFSPVVGYELKTGDTTHLLLDFSWLNVGSGTFQLGASTIGYASTGLVTLQAGVGMKF